MVLEPYNKLPVANIIQLSILVISIIVLSRAIIGPDRIATAVKSPDLIIVGRIAAVNALGFLIGVIFGMLYIAFFEHNLEGWVIKVCSFYIIFGSFLFLFRFLLSIVKN